MRGVAFAAMFAACVGLSGVANATDLFTPPPQEDYAPPSALWTGFYFGGHGGWSWGKTDVKDVFTYTADPEANNSVDTSGVIAGVQVGYNFRNGNLVYGVEAELGYMDMSGSGTFDLPNATPGDRHGEIDGTYSLSGGLYGDLTARLGYASDKTLLYVKGGLAFVNTDFDAHYVGENCSTIQHNCGKANPSKFDFGDSETMFGWTVGVGVEYALTSSLSLKVEYQHFDFGSASYDYKGSYKFNDQGYTSTLHGNVEYSPTVDAVKVGVNYQLDGGRDQSLK